MTNRLAHVSRATRETNITLDLALDGAGRADIATGVGFADHMLELLTFWGGFDLTVSCHGDVHVDAHHTLEDVGLCLGQAFLQALGDRAGIARVGWARVPMDEALTDVALDLSGRPYLVYNVQLPKVKIGQFDTELAREFFQAFANHCGANLHISVAYGENAHHIIEGCFKAFARAMDMASQLDPRVQGVLSTKGAL